jgi:hypothetical protein
MFASWPDLDPTAAAVMPCVRCLQWVSFGGLPMPVFGHVPGNPVSTSYADRRALSESRVHGPTQTGIWGTGESGAVSIVVSGGYEDDEDYGSVIVYTGQGGRDAATG